MRSTRSPRAVAEEYDFIPTTSLGLLIALAVIVSLPLVFGLSFWLPGYLEHAGLLIAQSRAF